MSTDHAQEQEMEIEALEAILMDEFKEIHPSESGLNTSNRCFQITLSPQVVGGDGRYWLSCNGACGKDVRRSLRPDDEVDESTTIPVQLALIFSHTEKYPDEPPLLNLKSLRGIQLNDLRIWKENLEREALENLGMAMIYTLVSSAKEWLSERFGEDMDTENGEEEAAKDDIIVPHGDPVTVDTFLAWRERFEAELALERAKLMPESALTVHKEKKLSGRQWFESGKAKGAVAVNEESDVEDEEIEFDDEDFEDDEEEDMLEHYLAEKSDA